MDEFLTSLPNPGIQQISIVQEVRYDPNYEVNDKIQLIGRVVPEQMVYIFTDVVFFGLTPAHGLTGASEWLGQSALNGLLRFQLEFSNNTPMELEGVVVSPPAGTTLAPGRRGGWPFTDRRFGVQRSSGWALYAKEGVSIDASAVVDVIPRFPISVLGVEMHGFSLTHDIYQRKIVKDWRAMLRGPWGIGE
jgi:hypothetical protein